MDRIKISNLEIFANHGIFQEETRLGQKFLISAELFLDLHKAGCSDNMHDSIHYGELCHFITEYLEGNTFGLIEAAAEHLVTEILLTQKLLKGIALDIKKPWAPIGLPIETVAVSIYREWQTVYLSVGSNMGDKEKTIRNAVDALGKIKGIRDAALSSLSETEPYGDVSQPSFLNGAIRLETILPPYDFLDALHTVEADAGRERQVRWGARTLDLDIIFYGNQILEENDLIIPHIDMANRLFVLKPLMELCPGKVHPVLHRTVSDLYAELSGESYVNK